MAQASFAGLWLCHGSPSASLYADLDKIIISNRAHAPIFLLLSTCFSYLLSLQASPPSRSLFSLQHTHFCLISPPHSWQKFLFSFFGFLGSVSADRHSKHTHINTHIHTVQTQPEGLQCDASISDKLTFPTQCLPCAHQCVCVFVRVRTTLLKETVCNQSVVLVVFSMLINLALSR